MRGEAKQVLSWLSPISGEKSLPRRPCRRSEEAEAARGRRNAGTDRVREEIAKASAPQSKLGALKARKRQALSHPTYFCCGSSIFSPFLNTP